jgi:hypothetical protein
MDRRVEVRCTEEQLARWKEAAGDVPLGRWIRGCCESRVDGCEPLVQELGGSVGGVPMGVALERVRSDGSVVAPGGVGYESAAQSARPAFKPDFKGG